MLAVAVIIVDAYSKYQVKPHSTPWFSATCAAANHFFVCTGRIDFLNLE